MNPLKRLINKFNRKFLIKYIVWDFDGTLYESKQLVKNLELAYFNYINQHKKISKKKFSLLLKKHKKFSLVASQYLQKPEKKIIKDVDKKFETVQFLKENKKLVKWLESMSSYQHFILSNSSLKNIRTGLIKIGFKQQKKQIYPFVKIFGKNNLPELKPNKKAFSEVQKTTKKAGFRHLMIGDSWKDDIIPAKKAGFQAVHVDELNDFFS